MTDKKTLLTFSLLLTISCSHQSQKEYATKEKVYSMSTQRDFEAIEKGDIERKPSPLVHEIHQQSRPSQHKLPKTPPLEAGPPKLTSDNALSLRNQERLQEINQNLAFYCMKHRKDRFFSTEEHCLKFTQTVLKACEKKHKLINTVMVNCIKDRLKKRK